MKSLFAYSRGKAPHGYSFRVACTLSMQFEIESIEKGEVFEIEGKIIQISYDNGSLILKSGEFSTEEEAVLFYQKIRSHLGILSLQERLAIFIPPVLEKPKKSDWNLPAGADICREAGWPNKYISPLTINNIGAFVYPEHKYVIMTMIYSIRPIFKCNLRNISEGLKSSLQSKTINIIDEKLMLAISGYTQAIRSTQWIWRFLLTVTSLEMLAEEIPTSTETKNAISELIQLAERKCKAPNLDHDRIKSCLSQANKISITKALQNLFVHHCVPGIACKPLPEFFCDEIDCRKKVSDIYKIRSKYAHEGCVSLSLQKKHDFYYLSEIATASLKHILERLISEKNSQSY